MFTRNGECPLVVLAPSTPADCFTLAIDAVRIALRSMVPVMFLSDGYIANSAEPWMVPDVSDLEPIEVTHPTKPNGEDGEYLPYLRDENLSRPWALPGTPGLMHRVGGLEKAQDTGNVSYDPENHQKMTEIRAEKVARVANHIPELEIEGDADGDVLLLGWGSTYGAIREARTTLNEIGMKVAQAHLRYINPMPKNTGDVLKSFKHVIIPELNMGQLAMLIRAEYLVDAKSFNKVQGRPFAVQEIIEFVQGVVNQ